MSNDTLPQLSEREREILRLVATGATNQQIAAQLNISANTVKVHLRNIFGKIGVASRTEATMYAVRSGIVEIASVSSGSTAVLSDSTTSAIDALSDRDAGASASVVTRAVLRPSRSRWLLYTGIAGGVILAFAIIFGLLVMSQGGNSLTAQPTVVPTPQTFISSPSPVWTLHPALPYAQRASAAVSFEGRIFVIGGTTDGGVTGSVWRYDPSSQIWAPLNAKPTPVRDAGAVVLNGKIYVPGGRLADGNITDKLEVFDPALGAWSERRSLPAPRSAYALAAVDGRLYLFGGWDGSKICDDVFAYDPVSDTWERRPSMPTGRAYAGASVVDGNIYVIGGEDQSGALTVNEQYAPSKDGEAAWTPRAALPEARSRFGSAALSNLIFVLGGVPEDSPLYYDVRNDGWRAFAVSQTPLGEQPAVAVRDASLFVVSSSRNQSNSPMQELRMLYTVVLPAQ
ncbi:kelch repeat-containing protein [Roseiflexus sp.]|uniref:kelch repeat-containing protein n=1 Tax=Roseiflexus sp. TaxID=2562120 RepID=UPI0021DE8405|nr:kelch repeat-containing protein [Roseiflexus sp.]GIV99040.1 MAG: LuxR family transcriptional regulator [Roseiflexus sp.]